MPRPIRFIPTPGALVEVTTRTLQGRLLLRPTLPTNQAVLGVFGRAQKMFGMPVHGLVVLSNHYHLLASPRDPKHLADFMTFVNSNIAREVGRLAGWTEKIWGRRYQSIPVSDEREAQVGRLRYILENSVKENLVESPLEWPGVHCARALLEDRKLEGIWFDRSAYHRARKRHKDGDPPLRESDFKTIEVLELSPLPCLAHLSEDEQRAQVETLIREIVAGAAAARQAAGVMVLGSSRVQKQDPHTQPNRVKKSRAPRFHAAAYEMKRALRAAYSEFVVAFRVAAEKLRSGDRGAIFPDGCFPPALPFCG